VYLTIENWLEAEYLKTCLASIQSCWLA